MITKQKIKLLCAFLALQSLIKAQNVVVSGALVGNGTYVDLNAAFTAVNGGAQTGAAILLQIVGNTNELVSTSLNNGAWTSFSIQPVGSRTITGNFDGALIDLNGTKNVDINGLNSGTNALTISNTNSVGLVPSAIRFTNDASNNKISNCIILGSNANTGSGVITFSNGIATGNDNNTITTNTISSAGTNYARQIILSVGTIGFENSGNIISNNLISDYFNANSLTAGISINANNSDWVISGNKLFQTLTRTFTTANTHSGIIISGGNNYLVTNNIIGYSTANATGTYSLTGTIATRFIGINVSTGTIVASTIQGNTITAISLNTSSGATSTNGILCGINVTGGNVNVINNLVGGNTGTDLLKGVPTTAQGLVVGINSSSTGNISISTNAIGGLSSSGITAAISGGVSGINISGIASSLSINGNTIGNSTINNMRGGTSGLTTGSSNVSGINLPSSPLGIININANTIQNLSSFGTGSTGYVRGIWTTAATGSSSTYSINLNSISNLITNSALTGIANGLSGALGINIGAGSNSSVSSNTISEIANTNTTTVGNIVAGITNGNATNTKISGNKIYNLSNFGTSTNINTPNIASGIIIRSGTTNITISNNFISLGNGLTDNTCFIGIMANHGSTPDPIDYIYFNTINIEGTATAGAQPSFGFIRGDLSATSRNIQTDFRNNIITNTRSGGTGLHFAIGNNYNALASSTGWATNASNNNILNASTANVGYWNAPLTFSNWQTASNSDANSFSGITVTYVNSANDLHLNMGLSATKLESQAQVIPGINFDIDNQNRPGPTGSVNGGGTLPDIGADEFDGVPLDSEAPVITYTNLATICASGDRTLTATISDLTGVSISGSLKPRIYFNKNGGSYFSNAGNLVSGTANNGIWNFPISMATLGGVVDNDVLTYFVIAQDIKLPTPYIGANPSTGLIATDVNSVTVNPVITTQTFTINLTPSIAVSNPSICIGQSYTYTPSGASTYTYSSGTAINSPTSTTNYTIIGTGVNSCTNSIISTITVNALPTVSVNNGTICAGSSFTLIPSGASTYSYSGGSAIVSPTTTTTYNVYGTDINGCTNLAVSSISVNALPAVSVNSGAICIGKSFTMTPSGAISYSYSSGVAIVSPTANTTYNVYGTDVNGCTNFAVSSITVNALPTVSVNSGAICIGKSFTMTPSGASSYSYSSGAAIVSPTANTTYNVYGTDVNGCTNFAVSSITVNALPTVSVNSGAICIGKTFTMTPSGASSYSYSSGAAIVSPTANTTYNVFGTDVNGCTNFAVSSITVNTLPTVTSISSNSLICSGATVTLTASGAATYSWSNGTSGVNTVVSPTTSINYTVTGTDVNGCVNVSIVTQSVSTCTGIENNNSSINYAIYPNPNNGHFTIELNQTTQIIIYNNLGQIVYSNKLSEGRNFIDLINQANGIYTIVLNQNTINKTIKIIKE